VCCVPEMICDSRGHRRTHAKEMYGTRAILLRMIFLSNRESHINSPRKRLRVLPSARCNHHVLASMHSISCRSRIASKRQCGLPQQLAARFVECPNLLVEVCCRDKEETAGGYDGAAIVFSASFRHALGRKLRIL